MRRRNAVPFAVRAAALLAGAAFAALPGAAHGTTYVQTDLASDIPGLASVTDPRLLNSWGVAGAPAGPFWVSDQGSNSATLYQVQGATGVSQVNLPPNGFVAIPTTSVGPQGPSGQVFNATGAFPVNGGGDGGTAHFLFANLNGQIDAWDTGATAFPQVTTPGAIYTGLALSQSNGLLYAANTAGGIGVFGANYIPPPLPVGAFVDPQLPPGLVPFNVADIGGLVYVTYAPAGRPAQQNATAGEGAVAVFTEAGTFVRQLLSGGVLAAPWGIALAPAGFGAFGGDLLVGNFSFVDSAIDAFDPTTGAFLGALTVNPGAGNTPGGLWALAFGSGGRGGDPDTLYVTDGINGETDGLFAAITPVPEPPALALLAGAMAALAGLRGRRRRR